MRMYQRFVFIGVAGLVAACARSVDVAKERDALLAVDREWSEAAKDPEGWLRYLAPDASTYAPGRPVLVGKEEIGKFVRELHTLPGFSLTWTPAKADVSTSGELGYTVGSYQLAYDGHDEKGKYVTVWKKQPDGAWQSVHDIFNADAEPQAAPAQHAMVPAADVKWGDPPSSVPRGAKSAIISGDPSKAEAFVVRFQLPAGYKVPPHWHPTNENVSVLAGALAMGMGDTFDEARMTTLSAGSYVLMPAQTRHYVMAKTPVTIQVHGIGPFAVNYVNPADDPARQ